MSKTPAPEPVTRKSVTLPVDVWEEIIRWQVQRRIATGAEAVRQIILSGLAAEKAKRTNDQ